MSKAPIPADAASIYDAYDETAQSLLDEITKKWNDETLKETDDVWPEMGSRNNPHSPYHP